MAVCGRQQMQYQPNSASQFCSLGVLYEHHALQSVCGYHVLLLPDNNEMSLLW